MLRGGAHDEEAIEFEVVAVASGGADAQTASDAREKTCVLLLLMLRQQSESRMSLHLFQKVAGEHCGSRGCVSAWANTRTSGPWATQSETPNKLTRSSTLCPDAAPTL